MAKVQLALPTGSTIGRDGQVANARIINGYVEVNGDEAKSTFTVYAGPGLAAWGSGSYAGANRGMIKIDVGNLLAISGNEVITYDQSGNSSVTNVLTGTGRCYLSRNRRMSGGQPSPQISIITKQQQNYILESGVLSLVADTDLPAPVCSDYLAGFFLYGIEDGRLFCSALEDGNSIDPLATADIRSGSYRLRRILCTSGFLYVFTERTAEIWQPDPTLAGEAFKFAPMQQNIDLGISAPHSLAVTAQGLIWADHERVIRYGRDAGARQISTHAVERSLAELTTDQLDSAYAFTYSFHGHETYCLTSDRWTWEYDATIGKWHERQTYGLDRWRVSGHETFMGNHIVGNHQNGKMYRISPETYMDGTSPLVLEIWCPQSDRFPDYMIVDAIHVDAISGVGLNSSILENDDPHILLDYSDDGGKNFYGERMLPVGKIGEYLVRIRTFRWGTVKDKGRIWRIRASAAVLRGINQIFMEARPVNG